MFDQHTEFDEIPYEVNDCAEASQSVPKSGGGIHGTF